MNELISGAAPTLDQALEWIGDRVEDIRGRPIGSLADVRSDPAQAEGRDWLVVRLSPATDACALVPLGQASHAGGRIWVDFPREFVHAGPCVRLGARLTPDLGTALARYYGLLSGEQRIARRWRRHRLELALRPKIGAAASVG